jgi:hypothetical protein
MRPILALIAPTALLGAIALAACDRPDVPIKPGPAAPPAAAAPTLAAGFWQQTVTDRHGPQITRLCVDATTASTLASFDHLLGTHCVRSQMTQGPDGAWKFSTACDMGPSGKVSTEGTMRGDFAKSYDIDILSQRVGAPTGDGPAHVTVEMRRLGDCPTDLKPGDVLLPGNVRAKLGDLAAHA